MAAVCIGGKAAYMKTAGIVSPRWPCATGVAHRQHSLLVRQHSCGSVIAFIFAWQDKGDGDAGPAAGNEGRKLVSPTLTCKWH